MDSMASESVRSTVGEMSRVTGAIVLKQVTGGL